MSEHIERKHQMQNINSKSKFYNILDEAMLNEQERQLLILYYIDKKTYSFIADELGYSEAWVKKRHKKILSKIVQLL